MFKEIFKSVQGLLLEAEEQRLKKSLITIIQ